MNLERFAFFDGLKKESKEKLEERLDLISWAQAGSLIHLEGEKCSYAEFLLEGQIQIEVLDKSGKTMTVSQLGAGELLGSNLVFSSNPYYPMMVWAKSPVKLLRLDGDLILKLSRENPAFLEAYLQEISDRARYLSGRISGLAMKTIREMVMEFLLYESRKKGSNVVELPFSKKEWAQRLGVQRPSLSRELSKMKKDGLIDYDLKTITLKEKLCLKK